MPLIELHKQAEIDLVAACEWYEEQQIGLSKRFRSEVQFKLQIIGLNPKLYPKKYNNHLHFAPLRKFPYDIVYWYEEKLDTVFVTSIFNTKRNPEKFESK